jgi:hypothetical protein
VECETCRPGGTLILPRWKYCPDEEGIETAILLMVIPPRYGRVRNAALLKKRSKPNTMSTWRGGDDF